MRSGKLPIRTRPAAQECGGVFDGRREDAHKTYRASLVASDLLMRSLGRPNREQVVSDRPANLTTLEALDLSNSPLLAETLNRGGCERSKAI